MKNKIIIITFIGIVLSLTALDLAAPDRYFSENENRILTQKPEPTASHFFSGGYAEAYENYVTDQFAGRDKWIQIKTGTEKAIGEALINGVYLGRDGYLFRQYLSEQAGGDGKMEESAQKKLAKLEKDVRQYEESCKNGSVRVMLIPSSGAVLQDKLPPYAAAGQFSETEFLKQGREVLADREKAQAEKEKEQKDVWIDVFPVLFMHREEPVYYRTDHHWTTLGAYYGYTAWAESMGVEAKPIDAFERMIVSDSFLGTLQSRLNLPQKPDAIELFLPQEKKEYNIVYDMGDKTSDSLYEKEHLQTKNQYGVFLDDNHGLVEIRTSWAKQNEAQEVEGFDGNDGNRSIAVIKDSYANCFVPFLTEHYKTVYVIDKRYYRGKIEAFLEENGINDVLILYQTAGFIENY